jgi:hypothetical protein
LNAAGESASSFIWGRYTLDEGEPACTTSPGEG